MCYMGSFYLFGGGECTLNIKQKYLLRFLLININSDVLCQISVSSSLMVSILKQTPDTTYWRKTVKWPVCWTVILRWPDPIYLILIQLLIGPLNELFSQNVQVPIGTTDPRCGEMVKLVEIHKKKYNVIQW